MAVHMTIDLNDATFADLVALVDAARVAGIDPTTPVTLEEAALTVAVEPAPKAPHPEPRPGEQDPAPRPLPQLGDAAIRSVVDILTGRQEPPRR
ncbi:hypothetical protein M5J20_00980 [Corynebacterium sp. TA-R-1]|uniref:Uncharacterized protein n=1 Tax=Corynebacterium stercoris TaxID=2943490 RepID=A0ABT1G236_9CORY|nr:hypothetical protein [Corynebacterium stercoris]MCP1386777.1 hypothetical protein [Corynebacterium stercoris]